MLDAITTYAARLAATKSVGLFYFAGHGLQLAWRNFLVPVDAVIEDLDDIPSRCVDLGMLMNGITKANNPMNVVVLDACRQNPFSEVKLEAKGLSQLDAPPGTLLAFATSPGNVASDGDGNNGLYTENLLRELKVPEAKIEDVFKRVRLGVRRRSNGQQIPWESTSLEEDFYFLPPKQIKPVAQSEADRQFEAQLALWEKIKASKDLPLLEDFLRRYPSGQFSELAQLQLDRLLAAQGEKKIKIETAPTPFSQGTGIADTDFKVGDTYAYMGSDLLTKIRGPGFRDTVKQITETEIIFGNGRITDHLGNPIRTPRGLQYTSQQTYVAEYRVGKKWSSRTRYQNPRVPGRPGEVVMEFRVVAREKITVPAGTFDAFKIEGAGIWSLPPGNGETRFTYWRAPDRVRRDIANETLTRSGNRITSSERYELMAFRQS